MRKLLLILLPSFAWVACDSSSEQQHDAKGKGSAKQRSLHPQKISRKPNQGTETATHSIRSTRGDRSPCELNSTTVELLRGQFSSGLISRVEWESMWMQWARENPIEALNHLGALTQLLPGDKIGIPDKSKVEGFVAGLDAKLIPQVLAAADKLPADTLNCLCTVLLRRSAREDLAGVVRTMKLMPESCDPTRLGNTLASLVGPEIECRDIIRELAGLGDAKELRVAAAGAAYKALLASPALNPAMKEDLLRDAYSCRNLPSNELEEITTAAIASTSPQKVCEILFSEPSTGHPNCVAAAVAAWAASDPESAGTWVNSTSGNSSMRDWAIAGYCAAIKQLNPPAYETWASQIKTAEARMFAHSRNFLQK